MNFILSLLASMGAYVLVYTLTLLIAERYPVVYHSIVPILLIIAIGSPFGGVGWAWIIGLNVTSITAVYFAKQKRVINR